MICLKRWSFLSVIIFLTLLSLLVSPILPLLRDRWEGHDTTVYLKDKLHSILHPVEDPPWNGTVLDQVIVMAKLESEDTSWVSEHLPSWQRAIYHVNPTDASLLPSSALVSPANKGHESMVYLTYIIDHYNDLPSVIAFLHSHRDGYEKAWHTDAPLHDNVASLRALQLPFVQVNGYVNLRCNRSPGCSPLDQGNSHVTFAIWEQIFADTASSVQNMTARANGVKPPLPKIEVACCAQFAVSRRQVLKRPREDYERFRDWLLRTELNDATSGRIFEYLWHMIFSMDAT